MQFELFDESTRTEYDGNFAYRFCSRLRSYSQHCGAPIQDVRASSRQRSDGVIEHAVSPVFDARLLLDKYKKWSGVRGDLEAIGGEFSVPPVIDSLLDSCERIYAKTLRAQADTITEAFDVTATMADRVPVEMGAPYLLGASPALGAMYLPKTQVELLGVDLEVAMRAENALNWAADLLSD